METNFTLVGYKDIDHAPDGYEAHIYRHGLYLSPNPDTRSRRFFAAIDPVCSQHWMFDDAAERHFTEHGYISVSGVDQLFNKIN